MNNLKLVLLQVTAELIEETLGLKFLAEGEKDVETVALTALSYSAAETMYP